MRTKEKGKNVSGEEKYKRREGGKKSFFLEVLMKNHKTILLTVYGLLGELTDIAKVSLLTKVKFNSWNRRYKLDETSGCHLA